MACKTHTVMTLCDLDYFSNNSVKLQVGVSEHKY